MLSSATVPFTVHVKLASILQAKCETRRTVAAKSGLIDGENIKRGFRTRESLSYDNILVNSVKSQRV